MNEHTRHVVQERAQRIAERAMGILRDEDPGNREAGEAFKYGYLLLRGPKQFLSRFGAGDLRIDPKLVEEFMWEFRAEINGVDDIMPEEMVIVSDHNREVEAYLTSQRQRSLVAVR